MRRIVAGAVLLLLALPSFAEAAEPLHGNVVLVLEGALSRGAGRTADLELELPCRNGAWPKTCWGYAVSFNRAHHEGVVTRNELADGTRTLSVEVAVGADPWVKGGRATYTIQLRRDGDRFAGQFTGSFSMTTAPAPKPPPRRPTRRGSAVPPELQKLLGKPRPPAKTPPARVLQTVEAAGKVRGRVDPPWPGLVEGHVAVQPGEHPRLIFRKAELPLLKTRAAETPEGKAILERLWAVLDRRGPQQSDKFTSWPAVGYGFAYQMTGERTHAQKAREIIQENFFARAPSGGQDIHHGPRLQGLALAFDLCYDGWSEPFRLRCIDEIQQRTWELATGQFQGRGMGGLNLNVWSNHNGIRAGCAALGALAILGEKNSRGEVVAEARHLAEVAARELRDYLRMGLGGSGWSLEGMFYKGMTLRRGFAHALHAYPKALGWQIDAGTLGDFTLVGYFVEAEPGRLFLEPQSYDGLGKGLGVDGESLRDILWSTGLATVPGDMMPGVKWLLDRSVGLQGSKTFGIGLGLYAPYVLASYPFEVEARPPAECFRWMAPDPRKGHYVFRPAVRDKDDVLLVLNLKSEVLPGCHYERAGILSAVALHGFGRRWLNGQYLVRLQGRAAVNVHHGPRVTSHRQVGDRACVLDMTLDRAYLTQAPKKMKGGGLVSWPGSIGRYIDAGVRGTRSMAVDCSGKSGAPLLVALVDRVTVKGAAAPMQWWLPVDRRAGAVAIDGSRFTVGEPAGPSLAGVLVAPGTLDQKSVSAKGGGTFFAVFTVQSGAPPELKVEGTGLAATVRVGGRAVRFADGSLVLE